MFYYWYSDTDTEEQRIAVKNDKILAYSHVTNQWSSKNDLASGFIFMNIVFATVFLYTQIYSIHPENMAA